MKLTKAQREALDAMPFSFTTWGGEVFGQRALRFRRSLVALLAYEITRQARKIINSEQFERSRARRAARTHCAHGHELTDDNVWLVKTRSGQVRRRCRTCGIESNRQNYQRAAARGRAAIAKATGAQP